MFQNKTCLSAPGRIVRDSADRMTAEPLERRLLLAVNPIVAENQLAGTSQSVWDVPGGSGSGDPSLQGFATDISVNVGQTINFKINDTSRAAYHIDIYRMGYYGGNGARLVGTIARAQSLVQVQPTPKSDATTGLVDAGNWAISASWAVPATAVSGLYFARATRNDTGGASLIFFVVRNDASHSDVLVKTDDATWAAYNQWGGNSFYAGSSLAAQNGNPANYVNRAVEVSYNRPMTNRDFPSGQGFNSQPLYAEYPMIRFLEHNGYDVSYFTDVDTDLRGGEILQHKVFMSVGHDEYWSGNERANVTAARDAGVNLDFMSGNEVYWRTRYGASTANTDGTSTSDRVLFCYKETWANAVIDPANPTDWTGTYRDPRFTPSANGGGQPENALTGAIFTVDQDVNTFGSSLNVPASDASMRFWRNTSVASLRAGQVATIGNSVLGYEWDEDLDNGFRPAGLMDLSSTTEAISQYLVDYGSTTGSRNATNSQTLYRAPSGALVFAAGTVQWPWGLDGVHDHPGTADAAMQQASVNLLADMQVQPGSLQSGLVAASASTDAIKPVSQITAPAASAMLTSGTPVTISGTASDSGGGVVAGVEVSTDGGATWHRATGRGSWSYSWVPGVTGTVRILSRAVDDSANLETPSSGVSVTVNAPTAPLSLWSAQAIPQVADFNDASAVEVGVRFTSDLSGQITGIRFYKSSANTGLHVGNLWSSSGTLLASATFSNETASGWQQVNFSQPVAITAGTTYVASYHTNAGHYSADVGAFAGQGISNGPLHALEDTAAGRDGMYAQGTSIAFPGTPSPNSSNFWVDVAFSAGSNTAPPSVTAESPSPGAQGVGASTPVTATFNEAVQPSTISFVLTDSNGQTVPASVSYNSTTHVATLTPNASLSPNTSYTATVSGARDPNGVQMTAPVSWSFTTAGTNVSDSSTAGFSAGTAGAGVAVVQGQQGGVQLAGAVDADFAGSALPSGWFTTVNTTGGTATVSSGLLTLDGTLAGTTATFSAGHSEQFEASFSGDPYQHGGLGVDLNANPNWAIFSTSSGGNLYARTNAGGAEAITALGTNWLGGMHRFQIDWTATGVTYWIDGQQVASHAVAIGQAMRPVFSDHAAGGGAMVVDWVAMSPYASSGTFTSRVLDGGASVNWGAASWTAATPSGTGLSISVRTGNTATPDGTWSAWTALSGSGAVVGGSSRYLQYQAALSTSSTTLTPVLQSIQFAYTPGQSNPAPTITSKTPAPGATGVSTGTAVTATFSQAMNGATINGNTFYLTASGSTVHVAASVAYDATNVRATLTPSAPLVAGTTYQVTVSGTVTDANGNPVGNDVTWTFTTANQATAHSVTDNASAGFNLGTAGSGSVVLQGQQGGVQLAGAVDADFAGSALPSGWFTTLNTTGGTASVSSGLLTLDGTLAGTSATFSVGHSEQFEASFSGDPYQHGGLGVDLNANPNWAIFSTSSGGNLYARTNAGGAEMITALGTSWLGGMHRFQIDWTATSVTYWIEGQQVAAHAVAIGQAMRPVFSDHAAGGGATVVDWVAMSPYASSGTFTSRVLDAGVSTAWGAGTWHANVPAGTTLVVNTRTGNTAAPDASWSAWSALTQGANVSSPPGRYLQYQVVLTTSNTNLTSVLNDITFNWIS